MKNWLRGGLAVAVLCVPIGASAQSNGLADLVPDLILRGITLPGAADPGSPHAGHFTLGNPTFGGSQGQSRADVNAIYAVEAFNDRLRSQFANFPLGSSTGGFTYVFDAASGTYARNSMSFGPSFSERATTIGRGRVSVGANYQHTGFDTFGGSSLSDRSIRFYLPHTDCCNAAIPPPSALVPGFEGDIIEAALEMKATTDALAIFGNFGLTSRWDVGIAIPITRVDLETDVRATIIRLSTAATPLVHTFVTGQDVNQKHFSDAGTASGIGDIVLRTKYNLARTMAGGGLAAAVDVRLPTGDEHNLLGLGTTQAKVYVIASGVSGPFAPHFNIGYTISGEGDRESGIVFQSLGVSDEFNYSAGLEYVPHPRLTILGDLLGRTLIDAGNLNPETKTFNYYAGAGTTSGALLTSSINPLDGQPYSQLGLTAGNLNLLLGSAGAKFNVMGNLLLSGNILFPLNKNGLRDELTVAFGVEYAF